MARFDVGGSAPVFGPLGGTYAHFQATAKVPGKDCVAFVEGNVYGADGGFAPGIGFSGSQMDMDDGTCCTAQQEVTFPMG